MRIALFTLFISMLSACGSAANSEEKEQVDYREELLKSSWISTEANVEISTWEPSGEEIVTYAHEILSFFNDSLISQTEEDLKCNFVDDPEKIILNPSSFVIFREGDDRIEVQYRIDGDTLSLSSKYGKFTYTRFEKCQSEDPRHNKSKD